MTFADRGGHVVVVVQYAGLTQFADNGNDLRKCDAQAIGQPVGAGFGRFPFGFVAAASGNERSDDAHGFVAFGLTGKEGASFDALSRFHGAFDGNAGGVYARSVHGAAHVTGDLQSGNRVFDLGVKLQFVVLETGFTRKLERRN